MISYIVAKFLYSSFLMKLDMKRNDFIWEKYIRENCIDSRIEPMKSYKKQSKKERFISRLDLHGKTCDQAYDILLNFLKEAVVYKVKKVTLITGSAYRIIDDEYIPTSVLRREVPRWLLYTEIAKYVKNFEYAKSSEGGEGALYVYLFSYGDNSKIGF